MRQLLSLEVFGVKLAFSPEILTYGNQESLRDHWYFKDHDIKISHFIILTS